MKKIVFYLLLLIGSCNVIRAQTVDSIRVEHIGDSIKIHYKILNSKPSQVFKVMVLASLNGGLKSELYSVSGDCGDNVMGGKSDYLIIWDVFKDVNEVNTADFTIRAELKRNLISSNLGSKISSDRGFYILGVRQVSDQAKWGIKVGSMKEWGFLAMFILGSIESYPNSHTTIFSGSLDVTKRIVNKKNFKMNLFSGLIISKWKSYIPNEAPLTKSIESGVICNIYWLSFSVGISPFLGSKQLESEIFGTTTTGTIGIGVRF